MSLKIQIISMLFSFIYGIFFAFLTKIFYRYLFLGNFYRKAVCNFLFFDIIGLIYFFALKRINGAIMHYYFLVLLLGGFFTFFFFKRRKRKNN